MSLTVYDLATSADFKKARRRGKFRGPLYSNEVTGLAESALGSLGCAFARSVAQESSPIGVYSKGSLIAFRPLLNQSALVVALSGDGQLSEDLFQKALVEGLAALRISKQRLTLRGECFRWVHSDADGLPGIVIDEYGDLTVVQSSSTAGEFLLPFVLAALQTLASNRPLIERSSGQTRQMARLPERSRVLSGKVDDIVTANFGELQLSFRPLSGQKTGLFLDQRFNLRLFRELLLAKPSDAASFSVLDICSYVGAWSSMAALAGATEFFLIDQDKHALALAEGNIRRQKTLQNETFRETHKSPANLPLESDVHLLHGDLFEQLALLKKAQKTFDVVVADPPAFAKSKAHLPEALRAYVRIVDASAQLLNPGGLLVVCSCSRNVTEEKFFELVNDRLTTAQGAFKMLAKGFQSPDHSIPVGDQFSHYLKCGFYRKDSLS